MNPRHLALAARIAALAGPTFTWLIWAIVPASVSVRNLLASRDGRAIRCLRGRRVMAESFGVDTARLKTAIFIHAALLASVSGWLYVHLVQFVNPTPFGSMPASNISSRRSSAVRRSCGARSRAQQCYLVRDGRQDIVPGLLSSGGAPESIILNGRRRA